MTEEHKKVAMELGALVILAGGVFYALYLVFNGEGTVTGSVDSAGIYLPSETDVPATAGLPAASIPALAAEAYGPPLGWGSNDNCGCGGSNSCPVSPNQISTLNQMLSQGANTVNQINALGNSTLEAIADLYNQQDPLTQYTVG